MTQPIKLTVNINPASAVRSGRSQCGTYEVLLTDDMLAQLDDTQREYLAMHLERKREESPLGLGVNAFLHENTLGSADLGAWERDTLSKLLNLRIAQYSDWFSKEIDKKLGMEEELRAALAKPVEAKRMLVLGVYVNGLPLINERGGDSLDPELLAQVRAENARRTAVNEAEAQALLDEVKKEEKRSEERTAAFVAQVLPHVSGELIMRAADGLAREGELGHAWETAVLKTLGISGYRVEYNAKWLTEATPEQYEVLRQERELIPVRHSEHIEVELKPAVLDGQFCLELKLVGNIGYQGKRDAIVAVKIFPEVEVAQNKDE